MVEFIQSLVPNQTEHRCKPRFPTAEVNNFTTSFWHSNKKKHHHHHHPKKKGQKPKTNMPPQPRNPQKFWLQNGIVINGYP